MVVFFCEICNQRVVSMPNVGDYVHQCNSGIPAIDNEDVLHFHTSFSDRGGPVQKGKGPTAAMWSGVVNMTQASLAGLMGEDVEELSNRGNKISMYRQRKKFAYKIIPIQAT